MPGELPDDVRATLSILNQTQSPPPIKLKPTRTMDDIALPVPPQIPQDDVAQMLSILDGNPPPEADASAPNPRDTEADVLKLALRRGVNSNTALAAHRKSVAQKLNIAPDLVTPQAEETAFYQDHNPEDLQKNYPALAKYLGVQGNAELVGKNLDMLKEVETFYRRSENDPAIALAKGVIGVGQVVVGLGNLVSGGKAGKYVEEKGLDLRKIQSVLNDLYSAESQKVMKDVGDAKGFWNTVGTALKNPSSIGLMTVESIPQMYLGGRVIGGALQMAFPALSFGAAGAIGEGITMAGGSAEQIRSLTDNGELTGKQTALAFGVGVLGTGLSALGNKLATKFGFEDPDADIVAGKLLNKLQESGVPKPLAVRIIGGAAIEGGVEEMPQSIVEQIAQNVALGRPWGEGVENAAAIGLVTGSAMGAAFQVGANPSRQTAVPQETPAEKQARTVVQNTILKTAAAGRAEDQRNAIQDWGKRIKTNDTLRKESPESFKEFIRTMSDEDGAVKEIFVDAKLLNETLAQTGIDRDQLAKDMPEVAEGLADALATNGEVRIPIEDYAAHIVGTPVENAILDHLRTTPDGMTYAESQVFFQQQQEDFVKQAEKLINSNEPVLTRKEFAAQAPEGMQYKDYLQAHKNKVEAFATDLREVRNTLVEGLNSTGRFPKSVSKAYAIPFSQFFAENAARMGILPTELYESLPLNFAKMQTADILAPNAGTLSQLNTGVLTQSTFYSALERNISGLNKLANKQGIIKTDQVEKWIASRIKDGTFKKDEVEAIGLSDFLKLKGAEVSSAEVENFVKQNGGKTTRAIDMSGKGQQDAKENIGAQSGFDITPELKDKTMQGLQLFQGNRAGFDPSSFTISLLQGADLSSVIHEGAHFYLEALADLAGRENAPQQIKDDFRTTLDWFGITGNEAGVPGGSMLAQPERYTTADNEARAEEVAAAIRSEKYEPVVAVDNGGSVYVMVNAHVLTKGGQRAKNRNPTLLDFKARFADHGQYWGATISVDPLTRNTVNDVVALFKFAADNSQPPEILSFNRGRIDPRDKVEYVETVGFNRNVWANGGRDYWRVVGAPRQVSTGTLAQKAFHGSPYSFDKFSTANIGTGEGAQAYGYGLYFTDTKEVAEFYKRKLSDNTNGPPQRFFKGGKLTPGTPEYHAAMLLANSGATLAGTRKEVRGWIANAQPGEDVAHYEKVLATLEQAESKKDFKEKPYEGKLYEVELKPNEDEYLLWDKPLSEQSEKVKSVLDGQLESLNTKTKRIGSMLYASTNGKIGAEIPGGMSGQGLYSVLKMELGSDKKASEYLHSIGIRGIKYLERSSRGKGKGSYNYVVFSDNDVDIRAYYQSQQGSGENQQPPSQLPPGATPEEIWSRMTLDQKRPFHEQWAQSYERYTLEGKAPTVEMQSVFSRFREWMLSVYKSMKDFLAQNPLAGKLNDDIRGVFDRLIASEEKIQQAEEARGYASLFGSAAEAGLSESEYEDYQSLGKLASMRAIDEMNGRSIRDMRWLSNAKDKTIKKLQAEANEKRAAITEQVTDEVDAMPLNRARNFLTTGEFIDEAGVRRESETKFKLNETEVKALSNGNVPENIKGLVSPDGIGLELAAKLLGFQSPETLVDQLVHGESRDATIQGLTDQKMLEQYGDLTDDKSIERAAEKAIHNDARARFMATGLKLLTKTELSAAQLNRAAKMAAEATIAKKKIRAITPGQFTRAEAKANREAIENVARDPKAAIDAQRAALINNRLAKAALEAADDVDLILKYFKKFESKGVRKAVGIDHIEQIDDLLQEVDRDKSLPLKEIDKRQALADWVAEQEADGFEPVLDPVQAEQIKAKHYKDMTVDELRLLRDTVKQIEHVGRVKQTLLTEMDRADFRERIDEAERSIRDNANRTVEEKGTPTDVIGETNRWVRQMLASHRKFSSFIREMDGGKDGGVMWRLLLKNMNAAGDSEVEMRRASSEAISDLFKTFQQEKAPLNLYAKRTRIPGTNIAMTQEQRIMFGMNWGNEGNRQRLLDGGIEGKRALSIKEAQAILDTLSKQEWDFIQGTWDHIATYKDRIAALERKITGIEPAWVEPSEVKTKYGTYRGGYFPAKYDTELSTRSESLEAVTDTRMGMKGAFNAAATRKGFTQQRSEAVVNRPLLLSYNVIANHISEVTHRLAWQPWLIDANRVLKALDAPIREHYGAEVLREMRNTVTDIATGDVGPRNALEKSINRLRNGSTIVGMGWRFSTALLQPSGLAQSWARIGGRWVAKGMAETFKNLNHANESVNSKSSLMKNRDITMNREINDVLNRVRTNEGVNAITGSYFSLIGKMQRAVDIPTWFGAYEKALHDLGLENAANAEERARIESDAVALADQAVIDSQSGGQLKDLASIQRGHPGLKLFTNFYSYFSATYNLNIEAVRRTNFRSPTDLAFLAGDLILLNVMPVLFAVALKEATKGKCGDDLDCLVKAYGYEQMGFMFGQMVLLRDMGAAATVAAGGDQYGYSGPAGLRFFSDLYKTGVQFNQGEYDWTFFKPLVSAGGAILHFPTGQIVTTLDGIIAVENGDVEGLSILPALLFGPPKD